MIFNQIDSLFIHIPKCGGMSVINYLASNDIFHKGYDFHRKCSSYEDSRIDPLFKFTFVRNTWDRLASLYYFIGPGAPHWPTESMRFNFREYEKLTIKRQYVYPKGFKKITFSDFIKNYVCNEKVVPNKKNFFISESIMSRLKDKHGNLPYDFIGRTETLSSDLISLGNILNLKSKIDPVACNKNQTNTDYFKLYDNYVMELVRDYFKEEIDYFDFRFNKL